MIIIIYAGRVGTDDVDGIDMAYRVVADHARTLSLALSDGGLFDRFKANKIDNLQKVLQRAIRFFEVLGGTPSDKARKEVPSFLVKPSLSGSIYFDVESKKSCVSLICTLAVLGTVSLVSGALSLLSN